MKKALTILSVMFIALTFPQQAYASFDAFPEEPQTSTENESVVFEESVTVPENDKIQLYQVTEDGVWFRKGGINEIDGIAATTREESEALEEELRANAYVLINSDERTISDEDYALLLEHQDKVYMGMWIADDDTYHSSMYRIYMFKPVYDKVISELRETGRVSGWTNSEDVCSTVAVNYAEWYHRERVGKIINEYNDSIPEWSDTGYLLISSPIDACITFYFSGGSFYNRLYVKANEPFLVEMVTGGYIITSINSQALPNTEESLIYNNNIQIWNSHSIESPRELNLELVVNKYDIAPFEGVIDEMPDFSWGNRGEWADVEILPEEMVEVPLKNAEVKVDNNGLSKTVWSIIFAAIFAVVALTVFLYCKITKRRNSV